LPDPLIRSQRRLDRSRPHWFPRPRWSHDGVHHAARGRFQRLPGNFRL